MIRQPPQRNWPILLLSGSLIASTTSLVVYSPTLYQMFCDLTGYGGTVQRAAPDNIPAPATGRNVTVAFDANVASNLPWTFRPEQREVDVPLGEPVKVYYYAENISDETVVGRATFNVTPYQTAPYFFKIECFCFTEERLGPGESARMPLVLYIDEQMMKDDDTRGVSEITLSYTFYRQSDLSAEEVAEARDLSAGSEATDRRLESAKRVDFANDAPRR